MSHIAVDTNLPDCAETIELEELLGYDEVWRHLFYLWTWAFESDFQTGIVKLTPRLLARAARWSGDPQTFFDALCQPVGPGKLPWLVNKGRGYFYLRGWSRNGRFFKKKEQGRERQRRYREKFDAQRDALRDGNGDGDVCPDSSRSPSRSPSPSPSLSQSHASSIVSVFDHYRKHHPRSHLKPKSTMKEWRSIRARLEEGSSVDDLCKAIDGMHKTPHNLGENDKGQKYLCLELCMRNGGQVQRFMENDESPPKVGGASPPPSPAESNYVN